MRLQRRVVASRAASSVSNCGKRIKSIFARSFPPRNVPRDGRARPSIAPPPSLPTDHKMIIHFTFITLVTRAQSSARASAMTYRVFIVCFSRFVHRRRRRDGRARAGGAETAKKARACVAPCAPTRFVYFLSCVRYAVCVFSMKPFVAQIRTPFGAVPPHTATRARANERKNRTKRIISVTITTTRDRWWRRRSENTRASVRRVAHQ